ncbi:Centrin-2 [Paragonimus westermani]|uniref:Centrin-2 n=1 Tax=Paragonimus westermani TaxID=34504 RepID=A0A8T0CZ10_9TREM|nr:Centrin-2 [Paragonimus westermani]
MQDQSDSGIVQSGLNRTTQSYGYFVPKWPKIELTPEFKEDIRKAFTMFDVTGEGTVSVDAVRVAFRALGYDAEVNEFKELRRQTKDVGGRVDFGEFLSLVTDRMLSMDNDTDIGKSFELMDNGNKGYIDLDDLRMTAQKLELPELYDDDFAAMLLGAQISDPAEELQKTYQKRQKQARIHKGLSYGVDTTTAQATASAAVSGGAMMVSGMPSFQRARRLSSSGQPSPETLTVELKQFSHLMKLTRPPVDDIKLL